MRQGAILVTMDWVSEIIIHLMNQWTKKEGGRSTEPGMSMHQTYTQMQRMEPKMILYSEVQL